MLVVCHNATLVVVARPCEFIKYLDRSCRVVILINAMWVLLDAVCVLFCVPCCVLGCVLWVVPPPTGDVHHF